MLNYCPPRYRRCQPLSLQEVSDNITQARTPDKTETRYCDSVQCTSGRDELCVPALAPRSRPLLLGWVSGGLVLSWPLMYNKRMVPDSRRGAPWKLLYLYLAGNLFLPVDVAPRHGRVVPKNGFFMR